MTGSLCQKLTEHGKSTIIKKIKKKKKNKPQGLDQPATLLPTGRNTDTAVSGEGRESP